MKILNKKKTHFMHPSKDGYRNVEFGTVTEVQALINTILDAKKELQPKSHFSALETEPSEKLNH